MKKIAEALGPAGPLSILLSCPKCGGPFAVDDEAVSVVCEHCGSLLILSAPERDEIYLAEEQIENEAQVLAMVILYRVQAQRAEIVNRYKDQDGNPPREAFIQRLLAEYEERLRERARVIEARRFHVPYWHITGKIVQGILGRHADGPKLVRIRAYAVEHTVPGYEPRRANLRDRGLRLAASRVRPLTVRDVVERASFLPWVPVADQSYREIDKWKGQDLDPGVEAVAKHGRFLFGRRLLAYRPYWLARVSTDRGEERILADGGFATIAGYPDEAEFRALLALGIRDPLHSGEPSFRNVHVAASRCPDCGFEETFDRRSRILICPNCHRGLRLGPDGIRLEHYAHAREGAAASLDAAYLPFWRFEFRIQVAGAIVERLEEYARALFPEGLPPGFHAAGPHLWVPGVRLLGTEAGDEAFKECVEWIHAVPLAVSDEKIPLGGRPTLWGASVPEDEARAFVPFVLLGLHGKAAAARLNTVVLKKAVEQARVELANPKLVMVPYGRIPSVLLRGSPELEAQRVTVQAARAAAEQA